MSLPLPVASLIDLFDQGPVVITRALAGAINDYGEVTPGGTSSVTLDPVAIHVATGRDLEVLPEADRTRETIKIYSRVALYTTQGDYTADIVPYQGRVYRVVTSTNINTNGLVWVSLAQLVDAGGPPP